MWVFHPFVLSPNLVLSLFGLVLLGSPFVTTSAYGPKCTVTDGSKNYVSPTGTAKFRLLGDCTIVSEKDESLVLGASEGNVHTGLYDTREISKEVRIWTFLIPKFS